MFMDRWEQTSRCHEVVTKDYKLRPSGVMITLSFQWSVDPVFPPQADL